MIGGAVVFECWEEAKEQFSWCWMVEDEKLDSKRGYKGKKKWMHTVTL